MALTPEASFRIISATSRTLEYEGTQKVRVWRYTTWLGFATWYVHVLRRYFQHHYSRVDGACAFQLACHWAKAMASLHLSMGEHGV